MLKVFGFMLFWIAIGMIIGLMIKNSLCGILVIIIMMILGYNLFCGRCK